MAIHEITALPDPILRTPARKVQSFSGELQQLIDSMVETMRLAPGVGLAAPQVSVNQRVIVVEYGDEPNTNGQSKPPKLYVFVNPEIVRHSKETELANEACLSVPGLMGEVERYSAVTVRGLNRHGKAFRLKAKGWLARIFQHEIDHLDGVVFTDRATKVWPMEEQGQTLTAV